MDILAFGGQGTSISLHLNRMRKVPLLGKRTFALQVRDDSVQPLLSEGEVIFVNPDLPNEPGHYVVVESEDGYPERALLRQLKDIDGIETYY